MPCTISNVKYSHFSNFLKEWNHVISFYIMSLNCRVGRFKLRWLCSYKKGNDVSWIWTWKYTQYYAHMALCGRYYIVLVLQRLKEFKCFFWGLGLPAIEPRLEYRALSLDSMPCTTLPPSFIVRTLIVQIVLWWHLGQSCCVLKTWCL